MDQGRAGTRIMTFEFAQTSRASEVAKEIERLIDSRGLHPGDHVATKSELQGAFGAARATINEATKLLLDRGRITVKPGPKGGIFAAAAHPERALGRFLLAVGEEPENIIGAIAVRDHLEDLVLEEATTFRSEADIIDLREILVRLHAACDDAEKFLSIGLEFHRRVGAIAHNQVLASTYCGLIDFTRTRVSSMTRPPDKDMVAHHRDRVRIHADIVDVIESGDLSRVDAAIEAHYSGVYRRMDVTTSRSV